ncbi:MAG: phosphatidylglycerol:prolipoprotein diacylglycerol transferase [Gammaproteobacteria bacterium]|jgi:phosphatidylglycerol:prolipoprotein diacylglycerol transferase
MLNYPEIDPVALALGPIKIHWYGVTYLFAFASAWWLGRKRAQNDSAIIKPQQVDDLIFYGALGVVLGGRIGSVLFYNFETFLSDPLYLLRIWQGGMSFHGGFIGVLVAMEWYRRRLGCSFIELTDFIAPIVPLGLAAGRLGNFINAELWGAPSNVPWAMKLSCDRFPPEYFQDFAGPLCYSPRHPSQLYEMLLEGLVLFLLLWVVSSKPQPRMLISGLFLVGYGMARSLVELIRLPDAHIGYLFGSDWMTRGILLSLPMIGLGLVLIMLARRVRGHAAVS